MNVVQEMVNALPGTSVLTDPDVIDPYRHDRTTWLEPGTPAMVVLPRTTAEVVKVMKVAAAHGVTVVPRGAGSSLCAGSQGIDGAVTLSLERMDHIVDIDPIDQMAVVQPGVVTADISIAAEPDGLFYPPDPASAEFCSIGGNIATNAGGLCCVKYGVTRDYVQGLEVVLADGRVIQTGSDTIKGVAGLDLTSLFVGCEGTLGIVTQARLRLRRKPDGIATMVAMFPTLEEAGAAVVSIVRSGVQPSLLEIMDHATMAAVESYASMGLDLDMAALVVAQADTPEPLRGDDVRRMAELADANGASYSAFTADDAEAQALLHARKLAGPALESIGQGIWDDVAVPISRIPALITRTSQIARRHDVEVFNFGHAGDGNMHPTLLARHGDLDASQRALQAFHEILLAALDLGGTITGEHGVGSAKSAFLEREVGADNLEVQRSIKRALDPKNILNPGRWL